MSAQTLGQAHQWAPGDGSHAFHAGPDRDTVVLHGVSLTQLVGSINLYDWGLSIRIGRDDVVRFLGLDGEHAPFSGDLTLDGETLTFHAIDRIILR